MKHTKCAVCKDERRHDIESELADGARLRGTARKYQISYDGLWRHWTRHVTAEEKDRKRFGDAPAHRLKGMVAEEGISVLKDLNYARHSIIEALTAAPATDPHARAVLAAKLHENARIRGAITGELAKSPLVANSINIAVFVDDPGFAQFQADLIRALSRFPDARDAVLKEFERISATEPESQLPALEHHVLPQTHQAAP